MWFKNLRCYRIGSGVRFDPQRFEDMLSEFAFQPCGALDSRRIGWSPVLDDEDGARSHGAAGCLMICAREQEKLLPPSVLREQLDEQVRELERREGRDIGKRERRRLKDELVHTLLPRALTRSRRTWALIAPERSLLLVDTVSARRAEDLLDLLRDTLGSLPLRPLQPRQEPAELMTRWLAAGRAPRGFQLGGDCDLRDPLDAANVVRCRAQELASTELRTHLDAGKRVTMLELIWSGRVAFQLGEDYGLRRLRFTDLVAEQAQLDDADAAARFDSDMAIMSGELTALLDALGELFGEQEGEPTPAGLQ
jgi:recombination associated protein RdgC